MDPITSIVTALALGASSALKDTATQAVKDAYTGLKALIQRKYPRVSVTHLEEAPESKNRRAVLAEDLEKIAVAQDPELLQQAKNLLDVVQRDAPQTAGAIGVELEDIRGASLRISEILAAGAGVKVKGANLSGDIEIRQVTAGVHKPESPKA